MYASRIAGTGRRQARPALGPQESRGPVRAYGLTGPVHRRGSTRHDRHLMEMDDPAAWLMEPATEFHAVARRAARGVFLLAVGLLMTPAVPAFLG